MWPAKTLEERFWEKVDKSGDCWEWTASTSNCGYGNIYCDGTMSLAHRVAWEINIGVIPEGACVCHTCDNPSCVNPNHLFLGTHVDNMRDMSNKGRANRKPINQGEDQHKSKLTKGMVKMIRKYYKAGGCTQAWLALVYGVTQGNVASVINYKTWKHVQ